MTSEPRQDSASGAPTLAEKMRALAGTGHPRAEELRNAADRLDNATGGLMGGPDGVKRLLGNWARARKLWCEITGEPLI